jgi:hypothetical protein
MNRILYVPYFAQRDENIDSKWHDNACGIACVAMVMSFHYLDSFSRKDLIDEGVAIGGYTPLGWIHDVLVRLMRNHGLHSYSEEFRSVKVDIANQTFAESPFEKKMIQSGIKKITDEISNNRPVIVSVGPEFRHNKENHLIVIVGYRGNQNNPDGFYVHDPDNRTSIGQEIYFPLEDFINKWRKMAIFTRSI